MEQKLREDFRSFRNEFYKWEACFARPSKYYTKETAELNKMVSDGVQYEIQFDVTKKAIVFKKTFFLLTGFYSFI